MSRGRKPDSSFDVSPDLEIYFHPVSEPVVEFRQRQEEVQSIISRMIFLAKKRGRPSKREENYEEAA